MVMQRDGKGGHSPKHHKAHTSGERLPRLIGKGMPSEQHPGDHSKVECSHMKWSGHSKGY